MNQKENDLLNQTVITSILEISTTWLDLEGKLQFIKLDDNERKILNTFSFNVQRIIDDLSSVESCANVSDYFDIHVILDHILRNPKQ